MKGKKYEFEKNIKKVVIAVVAAVIIILIVAGILLLKNNKDRNSENAFAVQSTESVSETSKSQSDEDVTDETDSENTETSEASKSYDNATKESLTKSNTAANLKQNQKNGAKLLKMNSDDKETLCRFLSYVFGYGGMPITKEFEFDDNGYTEKEYFDFYYQDYNCSSSNAYKFAYNTMSNMGYYDFIDFCESVYNLNDFKTNFDCGQQDPLKKVSYGDGFSKINGSKYDSLMETVFNVSPNHKFVLMEPSFDPDSEIEEYVNLYYKDGYYYEAINNGGDGAGPKVIINKIDKQLDGKYIAVVNFQWGNDWGFEDVASLKVTVGLKEFDNCRIWSLYSYERA